MKVENILDAIGAINDKAVQDAREYKRTSYSKAIKWGTIVACFSLVLAVAILAMPSILKRPVSVVPPYNPDPGPVASGKDEKTAKIIDMDTIFVNEITGFANVDYARYNPATDNEVVWNKDSIVAYYGRDLTPAYIPDGLIASQDNNTTTVYIKQDGTVVEDLVQLTYCRKDEISSQPNNKNISISASKIGIVHDCIYLVPEKDIKQSEIAGTSVVFGSYSSNHDMYVAEFELNNIEYQVVVQHMELTELVKIVASIIYADGTEIIVQFSDVPDKGIAPDE